VTSKLAVQSVPARERVEGHQPAHRRQVCVGRAHSQSPHVRAANPASLFLPLPTLRGLAARAPPSHLLGARRFHCFCHRKQNNGHAEPEIPAPTAIAPRNDALSSHEMERNLGLGRFMILSARPPTTPPSARNTFRWVSSSSNNTVSQTS